MLLRRDLNEPRKSKCVLQACVLEIRLQVRYSMEYLTCVSKLTGNQLSPHKCTCVMQDISDRINRMLNLYWEC